MALTVLASSAAFRPNPSAVVVLFQLEFLALPLVLVALPPKSLFCLFLRGFAFTALLASINALRSSRCAVAADDCRFMPTGFRK
jgi:hypothetical protein